MVMDNAPWHRKARRLIRENEDGQYDDINDKIEFIDISPYSPDLNPIEQVWRITRYEVTHNRYHASVTDLADKLNPYFARYSEPNEKLAKLCTFNFHKEKKPPKDTTSESVQSSMKVSNVLSFTIVSNMKILQRSRCLAIAQMSLMKQF